MNIFFIDKCPFKSAEQLCNKHVVKMVLETAQMCSTAVHQWCLPDDDIVNIIYKPAYKNHPMTVWVRENNANMTWALLHGLHIGSEYKYRYGKDHKSTSTLQCIADYMFNGDFDEDYREHTTPPQCMPDQFKCDDYVEAYRNYYRTDKAHILQWTGRPVPEWIGA